MIKFLKSIFGKKKISVEDLQKKLKGMSKRQLAKELICVSQKINHNQCGVSHEFKKEIRSKSKNEIIKAIIMLRIILEKGKVLRKAL